MEKRGTFDYILLETTGLADPGNIAPLFWVDEGLGSTIYLDGIVTLVDARNILRSLDEPPPDTVQHTMDDSHGPELTTAHLQISHADIIVLNKSDLVTSDQMKVVQQRIQAINSLAKIHITSHSKVLNLQGVLLDLHGYDLVTAEELDFAAKGHSHLDPTISTMTLRILPLSEEGLSRLDLWLRNVLWQSKLPHVQDRLSKFEIHRVKGRICTDKAGVKLIQGVREVFEMFDAGETGRRSSGGNDLFEGKLVLIGRGLERNSFENSIRLSLSVEG
jgi:G3E family GTPase